MKKKRMRRVIEELRDERVNHFASFDRLVELHDRVLEERDAARRELQEHTTARQELEDCQRELANLRCEYQILLRRGMAAEFGIVRDIQECGEQE